ncbi:MAG: OmpA family protein, partial [Leptospiraceae bacterium]|nr:OmpA family protein [Leptospiraceae bacterium]
IKIQFEEQTIVLSSRRTVKTDGLTVGNQFEVELMSGRVYRAVISAPGYEPAEIQLDYRGAIPSGRTDVRTVYLEPIRPGPQTTEDGRIVPGIVVDAKTGLPLPASVIRKFVGEEVRAVTEVDRNGEFAITVQPGEGFELEARSHGYATKKIHFEESGLEKIRIELEPQGEPCDQGVPECIDNVRIYFALNSSEISAKEMKKIQDMAVILKKNPDIKIEVQGHTDRTYRGPEERAFQYNLVLSRERARTVQQALMKLGISKERLVVKGYSYLRPIVQAGDALKGAVNRRVEFRRIREQ